MQTVCEENKCVGCMACLEICPKAAIKIKDSLKFFNAVIDDDLCINCNACHKICQNNNAPSLKKSVKWYEGWSVDKREHSSSGGAAAEIISAFTEQGGIVCSCAFKNGKFGFFLAPDEVEPSAYIGSKYVKSNPTGIYKKIKGLLISGRKVLFLGLPCQVAAVKEFVGRKYQDNLYTIDLICHGTPSPKLLEMFLNEYGLSLPELSEVSFRSKSKFGLRPIVRQLEPSRVMDTYTYAFLNGLDYTENCYHCRYACEERISDITIGDSWGSELPEDEKQKGISLILCQTDKGEQLVNGANFELLPVDYQKAVECNHQLKHPSVPPKEKEKFFALLAAGKSFRKSVAICYPKYYMKQEIKKILIRLKLIGEI